MTSRDLGSALAALGRRLTAVERALPTVGRGRSAPSQHVEKGMATRSGAIAVNGTAMIAITFDEPFTSRPEVTFYTNSSRITTYIDGVTTTGVQLWMANRSDAATAASITYWWTAREQ